MRLENKVALIIGAGERTSRAVALLFTREGAKVVLAARRRELTEETCRLIRERGGEAIAIQGDAISEEDAKRFLETTIQTYGKLDILYNNVGGGYARQSGYEVPEQLWDRIMAYNLRSTFLSCHFAIPELIKNGGGAILNIAASFTVRQAGTMPYGAAKNGVIGLTQSLAREYRSQNIRVNCICPGLIRNPLNIEGLAPVRGPLTRQGHPEDIAYAALFLCSDEASWISGAILPVDGAGDMVTP